MGFCILTSLNRLAAKAEVAGLGDVIYTICWYIPHINLQVRLSVTKEVISSPKILSTARDFYANFSTGDPFVNT